VLAEVKRELFEQVEAAIAAGVDESRIVLDPGIGFAKRAEHNWPLVHQSALDDMALWGFPVLLGASRKRFLGVHETGELRIDDSMDTRDALTVELTQRAAKSGLWAVRVHRVEANVAVVNSSRVALEEAP
jgi:dihydropteroate synthase